MLSELPIYLSKLHATHDEDTVDRINYIYTNILLLGFSILLTAKQYVGKPLQCWVPAQFKGGWEQYVENHCFIENTYFVRMDEHLPETGQPRQERELAYYQWIPFILALQAALCYAPRLIWKIFSNRSGLNLTALIPAARPTESIDGKKVLRGSSLDYQPIADRFRERMVLAKSERVNFGKYVTILYLLVKALWLVNIFLQFAILNVFLGPQYTLWGVGIVLDLMNHRDWSVSGHFPRVTYCDVEVREMGNLHNWTVQCVLMVNMFAEKIFLFLWFWFSFVLGITLLNFIYWVYVSAVPSQSHNFIKKYLAFKRGTGLDDNEIDRFIETTIKKDGITILRLIGDNCGDLAVAEIVDKLWIAFQFDEDDIKK